jgi:hypothetical protein
MNFSPSSITHIPLLSDHFPQPSSDTDISTDNSFAATPQGTTIPTGSDIVTQPAVTTVAPSSPTLWEPPPTAARRVRRHCELLPESLLPSTSASHAETVTENDGYIAMNRS